MGTSDGPLVVFGRSVVQFETKPLCHPSVIDIGEIREEPSQHPFLLGATKCAR